MGHWSSGGAPSCAKRAERTHLRSNVVAFRRRRRRVRPSNAGICGGRSICCRARLFGARLSSHTHGRCKTRTGSPQGPGGLNLPARSISSSAFKTFAVCPAPAGALVSRPYCCLHLQRLWHLARKPGVKGAEHRQAGERSGASQEAWRLALDALAAPRMLNQAPANSRTVYPAFAGLPSG